MKYTVKKNIPLKGGALKKGDTIDDSDSKYWSLDFNDKDFFEIYQDPIYKKGQPLLYKPIGDRHFSLFTVTTVFGNKTYEIKNDHHDVHTITEKTVVKIPTIFWFINSNGIVSSDFEERYGINKDGLDYKKRSGNYFATKEICELYKQTLLKTQAINLK